MRIALDECVNPRVKHLLESDHTVFTVLEWGWKGLPDSKLLKRLQGRCDVFLTIDRGFEHEHNVSLLSFGIVIVHVARNRLRDYEGIRDKLTQALSSVTPGKVFHVG